MGSLLHTLHLADGTQPDGAYRNAQCSARSSFPDLSGVGRVNLRFFFADFYRPLYCLVAGNPPSFEAGPPVTPAFCLGRRSAGYHISCRHLTFSSGHAAGHGTRR